MPAALINDRHRVAEADRASWDTWLARLPEVVAGAATRWSLQIGPPFQPGGHTSWVAPALSPTGGRVVIKVTWPHYEADHEADGLRRWEGRGAVRLLDAQALSDARLLLLEACSPGSPLSDLPESEQDVVIAKLLGRLWISPPPDDPFRALQTMCEAWADAFEHEEARRRDAVLKDGRMPAGMPAGAVDGVAAGVAAGAVDAGLVREGIELLRRLPTEAGRDVLLCTDLHAGNVLSSDREPWLMIDPKPYVGDPAYDLVQHLLNCRRRLHADPRGLVKRVADLSGVDRERLQRWLFARCIQESHQWPDLLEVARQVSH